MSHKLSKWRALAIAQGELIKLMQDEEGQMTLAALDSAMRIGRLEKERDELRARTESAIPVGTVLVPKHGFGLTAESSKFLADVITAGDEPCEVTLRVGFVRNDDGQVEYGLLVEESECPEEGASMLCSIPFDPPTIQASQKAEGETK